MLVALEVSRGDRSREAREEQPSNMKDMSVTLEVSRPDRSIDATFEHSENIRRVVLAITPFSIFTVVILPANLFQGGNLSPYKS